MGMFRRKKRTEEADVEVMEDQEQEVAAPEPVGKKSKKDKKPKVAKKKTSFFNRKKNMTLIQRMQLEESVAGASLDVVQGTFDQNDSAVRKLDQGLLIIAITNDMLVEANLDPSDETFGAFTEGLRSETIQSITLMGDLEDDVIGIIPSSETLHALDEYEFIHDVDFKWALVPFDLTDDDRLILLDSTVKIGELMILANEQSIQVYMDGDKVLIQDDDEQAYSQSNDSVYSNEQEESALDIEPSYSEPSGYSGGVVDDNDDDDLPTDHFPTGDGNDFPSDPYPGIDDDSEFPDDLPDDDEQWNAQEYTAPEDTNVTVPATAEESEQAIAEALTLTFNNAELGLMINMEPFLAYFQVEPIAFDTTITDPTSEMQKTLSQLRQDANAELGRFHQEYTQNLRSSFISSLQTVHQQLMDSLDHKNPNNVYGEEYEKIHGVFNNAMQDIDRIVAEETRHIIEEYNGDREAYAENARREALSAFDNKHRAERDRKVERVNDTVKLEYKLDRDTAVSELFEDRRTVARQLFDKAVNGVLLQLQAQYQENVAKEMQMFDEFRINFDLYLRNHFADDVLRAKADVMKMQQGHEADRVRQEYEQLLQTKMRQLEDADKQSRQAIDQMQEKHQDQLRQVSADWENRIAREKEENENLRTVLMETANSVSKITEEKENEVQHRVRQLQDRIEAQTQELAYANDRAKAAQKPMLYITLSIAIVTLALGIIFGFIYGANSVSQAPVQTAPTQPVQQQQQQTAPVSMLSPDQVVTAPYDNEKAS